MSISITIFSKKGGPLTKRISLDEDGLINSDGSACVMTNGVAKRADIANVDEFADLIGNLEPNQAIALGQMRSGLPPRVSVVTKARLEEVNGAAGPRVIARTAQDIIYRKGRRAMALLDFDAKGMPDEMADELEERGGFWAALVSVLPVLGDVARVTRRSTSSGLFRSDTGESVPGSDGIHVYIEARDGSDIERFLGALHARCWLAGLGWMMVGAGGQLLERSIIDRMVGAPERLAFEGAPILEKPLKQRGRRPVAVDGDVLNTVRACPPLTVTETAKLRQLKEREAHRLAGEAAKARAAFIDRQAEGLAKRAKISTEAAKQIVARQCDGVLLSDVELPFDDPDLAGCTVADVLDDPDRFDGATLADPLEGIEYGVCKAKVMRRPDGSLWIHSFAHGRTVYKLKLDAAGVREALAKTDKSNAAKLFIKLAVSADLDAGELEELRNMVAKRSGVGLIPLKTMLKEAQYQRAAQDAEGERRRRLAERRDPRPMIPVPYEQTSPWLPQMATLKEIIGGSTAPRPPGRDVDSFGTRATKIRVPGTHAFTNEKEDDDD